MPRTATPDGPGERVAVLSRTTIELRSQLEHAASLSGRSLGQEVETRLERSFANDHLLGDSPTAHLLRALAGVVGRFEASSGASWAKDEDTRRLAFDAAAQVLGALMGPPKHDGPAIPVDEADLFTMRGAEAAALDEVIEQLMARRAGMDQELKRLRPSRAALQARARSEQPAPAIEGDGLPGKFNVVRNIRKNRARNEAEAADE